MAIDPAAETSGIGTGTAQVLDIPNFAGMIEREGGRKIAERKANQADLQKHLDLLGQIKVRPIDQADFFKEGNALYDYAKANAHKITSNQSAKLEFDRMVSALRNRANASEAQNKIETEQLLPIYNKDHDLITPESHAAFQKQLTTPGVTAQDPNLVQYIPASFQEHLDKELLPAYDKGKNVNEKSYEGDMLNEAGKASGIRGIVKNTTTSYTDQPELVIARALADPKYRKSAQYELDHDKNIANPKDVDLFDYINHKYNPQFNRGGVKTDYSPHYPPAGEGRGGAYGDNVFVKQSGTANINAGMYPQERKALIASKLSDFKFNDEYEKKKAAAEKSIDDYKDKSGNNYSEADKEKMKKELPSLSDYATQKAEEEMNAKSKDVDVITFGDAGKKQEEQSDTEWINSKGEKIVGKPTDHIYYDKNTNNASLEVRVKVKNAENGNPAEYEYQSAPLTESQNANKLLIATTEKKKGTNIKTFADKEYPALSKFFGGKTQPESKKSPTINSQSEYDALPKGAKYIDSNGKSATKK